MKATKATNIQIRLLVEESQQLNSKWNTRKKHKLSANEMIPISNYMQKQNKDLKSTNKKEKSKKKPLNFFLLFITRIAL